MRLRELIAAVLVGLLVAACAEPSSTPIDLPTPSPSATPSAMPQATATGDTSAPPTPEPEPAVLMAAGDIADCAYEGAGLTAELLANEPDATIAALGDLAYPSATHDRFDACYHPTWGRFLDRTRPAIGNHDLDGDSGRPYFDIFGDAAGTRGEGWYSYDLGEWHVVVLNSNCDRIDCTAGSAQVQWLLADLAASDATCTLAYWHHPRFTSGPHGEDPRVGPFWSALAEAGADLILGGHDHHYERFAPMSPDGVLDTDGLRQFIAGTGGAIFRPTVRVAPGSEFILDDQWGVLRLELSSDAYAWSFLTVDGAEPDAGSGECH